MNIGIDANEANTPVRVGVGQYAYNLLLALSRQKTGHQFRIFLKSPPLPDMPQESANWQYSVFGPKKYWTRFALPLKLLFSRNLDLFYSPSHYSPRPSIIPTIPTIHDIGYLRSQDQFTKKDIYQLINWTKDSLFQAKHIIAVSRFSKNELIKTYSLSPQSISVCPNGVSPPPVLNPSDWPKIQQKYGISGNYFLSVGTLKPNKNYPFLISAFKTNPCQLVIAGKKGWLFDEVFKTVTSLNLQNKVIFTDYITETEKWHLYQHAVATVIPSLYEGFGIPAIESQIVGTPVIAADIPSLREVLSDSCLYIDPHKLPTLTSALQKIIQPSLSRSLSKAGKSNAAKFTWDNSAISLLQVFDSIRL